MNARPVLDSEDLEGKEIQSLCQEAQSLLKNKAKQKTKNWSPNRISDEVQVCQPSGSGEWPRSAELILSTLWFRHLRTFVWAPVDARDGQQAPWARGVTSTGIRPSSRAWVWQGANCLGTCQAVSEPIPIYLLAGKGGMGIKIEKCVVLSSQN